MYPETFRRALAATARVALCSSLLGCTPKPVPPVLAPPTAERTELSSCQAHTRAVFTDKTEPATPRTKACCAQIAESTAMDQVEEWKERDSCCAIINGPTPPSVACMPWGPPCPPALELV